MALGSQWIAAGAYAGTGGVALIRISDRTSHTAYPSASAGNRHDTKTYPDCPGPPGLGGANFTTHGVYVEPGSGPVQKLFVVGHGARESIEVFEVDTRSATPAVTWLGRVIAPDPIGLNSVRDVVTVADTPEFGAGTALVEVGRELWVGSFRGNGMAIVPAP